MIKKIITCSPTELNSSFFDLKNSDLISLYFVSSQINKHTEAQRLSVPPSIATMLPDVAFLFPVILPENSPLIL